MSRTRTGVVHESAGFLQSLEQEYAGTSKEMRVRMLRLLKEDASLTISDVALQLGAAVRTVERWWSRYRQDGLAGLLDEDRAQRSEQAPSVNGRATEAEVTDDEAAARVQRWFQEHSSVRLGRREAKMLVSAGLRSELLPSAPVPPVRPEPAIVPGAEVIPAHLLRFLNALPLTADVREWIEAFRAELQRLFPDIDRITITINLTCDMVNLEEYNPSDVFVNQHIPPTTRRARAVSVAASRTVMSPSEQILNDLTSKGFPLDAYHPPKSFDYFFQDKPYLATMILWRERDRTSISTTTLETIEHLAPFFNFVFSYCVARYDQAKPMNVAFQETFHRIAADYGLTEQERRVVGLKLLGYSYKEMADLLSLSEKTIKTHVNAIHRKTNTHRGGELIAKIIAPRIAES